MNVSLKDQLLAIKRFLDLPNNNHCCEICDKILEEIHEEDGSTQGNINKLLCQTFDFPEEEIQDDYECKLNQEDKIATSQSF